MINDGETLTLFKLEMWEQTVRTAALSFGVPIHLATRMDRGPSKHFAFIKLYLSKPHYKFSLRKMYEYESSLRSKFYLNIGQWFCQFLPAFRRYLRGPISFFRRVFYLGEIARNWHIRAGSTSGFHRKFTNNYRFSTKKHQKLPVTKKLNKPALQWHEVYHTVWWLQKNFSWSESFFLRKFNHINSKN